MTDTVQTTTSEGGDGAAEKAQGQAREVASHAQDRARDAAGQARGQVRDQVDQRSTQLADQVSSSASDARSVAEQLRNQGKQTPARYVEQAADQAERFGDYLRDSDGDRLLNDVEDFARRNTWAVALGGLALGFAASRLLKASSAERYRSSLQSFDEMERTPLSSGSLGATGGPVSREPAPAIGDVPTPGLVDPAVGPVPTASPADRPGFAGESLRTGGNRPGSGE
jgi:uncharacterized protein YjbJ (UPF0337 family)